MGIFFTRFALGPLSEIYTRAQRRPLNLVSLCNGFLARALTASMTYTDLIRWQTRHLQGKNDVVTTTTLEHKASTLFINHDGLDQKELNGMLYFLFNELCIPNRGQQAEAGSRKTWADSNDAVLEVPREDWVDAITSGEDCSPEMLSQLFNTNRRQGILERLFDPDRKVRKHAADCTRGRNVSLEQAKHLLDNELRLIKEGGIDSVQCNTPHTPNTPAEEFKPILDEPPGGVKLTFVGLATRIKALEEAINTRLFTSQEAINTRLGAMEKRVLETSDLAASAWNGSRAQRSLGPGELPGQPLAVSDVSDVSIPVPSPSSRGGAGSPQKEIEASANGLRQLGNNSEGGLKVTESWHVD